MKRMKWKLAAMAFIALLSACSIQNASEVKRVDALDASAWNVSKWISAVNAPVITGKTGDMENNRAADGASWFVSTVKNEQKVVSAKWMTAGLGVYEIFVNGQLIGEEFLKPGYTHYAKTKRSFTYDVTAVLQTGEGTENQFSAQVTPGWWADKIHTPHGYEGFLGKKCAFRGVLELTYADGSKKLYGTDLENWKAGIAGPVTHAAIFDGEAYDARIPMGYETVEKLTTPEENTEFKGEILPSAGAEVYLRKDLILSPVKAYLWKGVEGAKEKEFGKVIIIKEYVNGEEMIVKPGETLVVDFGQNCAGVPSFVFKAAEGTHLSCLPAELLNDGNGAESRGMDGPEGSVHRLNLRIPDSGMMLDYIFAGGNDYVTYHPSHTFYGYRFVSITATDEVAIRSLTSIPVTSITKDMETGILTTGNELINKLIANTYWGQLSNYLSVPTDCPQRNERLGWTADTQVFAETGSFFANTMTFFHKWMRDMRDSQSPLGGFPSVAPFGQYGNETMRLGWADAGIIVPWTVWKQFGDKRIIEENWAAMDKFMTYVHETKYDFDTHRSENGNHQYADWLSYEALEACAGLCWGPNGLLPEAIIFYNYLSASYWALDAVYMADMAAATGRGAARYRQ
ncbi:MAG: family 78 glycoside hydrolase catalytic domain, partial [Bacteroides sp.]|nr:family 78 glycoside hydrolase catalytic domain [Bacteroides sp.]